MALLLTPDTSAASIKKCWSTSPQWHFTDFIAETGLFDYLGYFMRIPSLTGGDLVFGPESRPFSPLDRGGKKGLHPTDLTSITKTLILT